MRVVVAAVPAFAAVTVLVTQYLQKHGVQLATALVLLHVRNLARRSSLEAGSKREIKDGEELRNVRNSV
jgi:hypothetical protein